MIEASRIADNKYLDASRSRDPDHLRGQFVPWARLLIPENGPTFKLTRGTLLVSSAQRAYLYDVEKAELQQTIAVQTSEQPHYVEISDQHAFVVSTLQLNVYDRVDSSCVLSIPAESLPGRENYFGAGVWFRVLR